MLLSLVKLCGLQLSGVAISWVEILLGGNFLGGNFSGGNCPVGIVRVASFWVGVFMLSLKFNNKETRRTSIDVVSG